MSLLLKNTLRIIVVVALITIYSATTSLFTMIVIPLMVGWIGGNMIVDYKKKTG